MKQKKAMDSRETEILRDKWTKTTLPPDPAQCGKPTALGTPFKWAICT